MRLMKLAEITVENIENKKLEKSLPELYELETVIQNNRSHINDPTLVHVISVRKALEEILKQVSIKIKNYLDQTIDSYSKKDLLLFSSVFHDIAKKETIQREGDKTSFPNHEEASAEKIKRILPRFDLSQREKDLVVKIIRNHGFLYDLPDDLVGNIDEKVKEFQNKNLDIFIEVVLHTKADLLAGQLKENNPEGFERRLSFFNRIINSSG